MNKKADDVLIDQLIFMIIVLAFFVIMLLFVSRAGSQITRDEQIYAKQFALMIDKAKPGTDLTLDMTELFDIAKKNKYTGEIVKIDSQNNIVLVKLTQGDGYQYRFFNNADIVWNMKNDEKKLYLSLK